jgi:methionyl aminopeptidase
MIVRNDKELEGLRRIGEICGETLKHMLAHVEIGMTTLELDRIGADFLKKHGAASAPITAYQYPGWTCISLNDEAAHGIPGKKVIRAGDIINIDVSAVLEGFWADTGASMIVPPIHPDYARLCQYTSDALYAGIGAAHAGQPISNIGKAIEAVARKGKYAIIRDLNGHGVGRHIHESPSVPAYNNGGKEVLQEGVVITIEPFLNVGKGRIITDADGWTLRTPDRTVSAQFEHTVVIAGNEPILITKVAGGH